MATKTTKTPTLAADMPALMQQLTRTLDASRISKATSMLKADRFELFSDVSDTAFSGVVKSQTDSSLFYSCRLSSSGDFSCCTQNLNACGGLRGALCKHLLVMTIGLAQSGKLDVVKASAWALASKGKKPVLDKDQMGETFLRYKGAQAGEVDWRPTETVPEDFYAL